MQVTDNEGGNLVWGVSYAMLGLMRMYQATGDKLYLDRMMTMGREVLAQTDINRGVTDYAGRSGWVWRSGVYTTGTATSPDAAGKPLFEVRWANDK